MFTSLQFKNFKSWADTGEIRFAPITGFFGTNSSGKTAILQFILMLKQTIESKDIENYLRLGGDRFSYVDLGTTFDIVHNHIFPTQIDYSLTWKPARSIQDQIRPFVRAIEEINPSLGRSETGKHLPELVNLVLKYGSSFKIDINQIDLTYFNYSLHVDDQYWIYFEKNNEELFFLMNMTYLFQKS